MKYDLSKAQDRAKASTRCNKLAQEGAFVEIRKIMPKRSNKQNNYLHLLLTLFAIEYGETVEYIKINFFKLSCNPEMFSTTRKNHKTGVSRNYTRSTAELSKEELTTAIERFKNISAQQYGIALPEATDQQWLKEIEIEAERYRNFI